MAPTPKAKDLNMLNNLHDPDTVAKRKITDQFAAMLKIGPEEWDYESDFSKNARIGVATLSAYRDQFKAHIGVTKAIGDQRPRTIWFADPKVAKKFRGE